MTDKAAFPLGQKDEKPNPMFLAPQIYKAKKNT